MLCSLTSLIAAENIVEWPIRWTLIFIEYILLHKHIFLSKIQYILCIISNISFQAHIVRFCRVFPTRKCVNKLLGGGLRLLAESYGIATRRRSVSPRKAARQLSAQALAVVCLWREAGAYALWIRSIFLFFWKMLGTGKRNGGVSLSRDQIKAFRSGHPICLNPETFKGWWFRHDTLRADDGRPQEPCRSTLTIFRRKACPLWNNFTRTSIFSGAFAPKTGAVSRVEFLILYCYKAMHFTPA